MGGYLSKEGVDSSIFSQKYIYICIYIYLTSDASMLNVNKSCMGHVAGNNYGKD